MIPLTDINFFIAQKSDKKNILRFYKNQPYSARFIGGDTCYLARRYDDKIIASLIISYPERQTSIAFLHALVTDNNYHLKGLASKLIDNAKKEHNHIICFANDTLAKFYQVNGFSYANKTELTTDLKSRFERYRQKQSKLNIYEYKATSLEMCLAVDIKMPS